MNDTADTAVHSLEADRRAKLARLREELGVEPYGRRTDGLASLAAAKDAFDEAAHARHMETAQARKSDETVEIVDDRPRVRIAGRVVLHRDNGKLQWLTLRDDTGDLQVAVSKRDVEAVPFQQAKLADLGDIVVASGPVMKTKTGEITVWADDLSIATKSLAAPPEKWSGLADPELRYRKRYVDLYANPEVMQTFQARSRILQAVRGFLTDPPAEIGPGFLEVETPMMQPIPGGAAARPFITHHNALDIDLYLRIAPELYLKRLLVGGMPRVFEINRNFRNEGIDRSHNPEFTMLELYQAFGDLYSVMELTERLIHHVATTVCGGETLPFGEYEIDYSVPFRRAKYFDLFREHAGFDGTDHDKLAALAREKGIDPAGKAHEILLNDVWEEVVEPHLVQPTFVVDYPAPLCPLTRRKEGEPHIAERFELYIAHMEIANAYTELNDPDVQLANFQQQIGGQDEEEATFRNLDLDFVEALKVGMPPAGGLGVGIDRVVMLLTNQQSIRDVILFPLLRPQARPAE